jgi:GGDEF domain-containing protein
VTKSRRSQLVRDLAALVVRYGVDEFATLLSDAGQAELIQEATRIIGRLREHDLPGKPSHSRKTSRGSGSKQVSKPRPLDALQSTDPPAAAQLAWTQVTLMNGPNFRSRSEMRALADSMGMREELSVDRRAAVRQLVAFAAHLPPASRDEFLARVRSGASGDQSLANWAKTIMGVERKGPAHPANQKRDRPARP